MNFKQQNLDTATAEYTKNMRKRRTRIMKNNHMRCSSCFTRLIIKSSPIETSRKRWASLSGSLEAGETTSEATPKHRASAWAHYYAVGPLGGGFAGGGAPVLLAAVCDRVTGRGGGA